jgi:hypothetical protein
VRQNSLSAHGDYGDFRVVLSLHMLKVFKHIRRIRAKYFSANGEYAKRILHFSHNTPRGIQLTLSEQILDQDQKNLDHLYI